MEHIAEAAGIARTSIATGANAFQQIGPKIEILANAGQFLKQSIENKTIDATKLKELWESVGEMAKSVNESFEQIRAASTLSFYQEAADISDNLIQMFDGILSNPGEDSFEYFKNSYDMNSPIETAYKTISLLEKKSTNPMRVQTSTAAKDWPTAFLRILSHFLYLESFANGLYQSRSMYAPNALKRRIELFSEELDEWKEETVDPLWANMAKRVIETIQKENTGNDEKVAVLEKTLKKSFPKETTFTMVYNECDGAQNHVLRGPSSLAIQSVHLGGTNVVVTRSAKWKSISESEKDQFRAHIKNLTQTTWQDDYTLFVDSLNGIKGLGFVALVSETLNLAVGNVDTAPGALTRIRVEKEHFSGVGLGKTFTLFAGYQ
ncbi:unnamed protein product [Caenorhabditis sp. 36 PRJEB53466]|nr:unnamed protein product [Caenorhabditis sp. 36 PRJEB53466]